MMKLISGMKVKLLYLSTGSAGRPQSRTECFDLKFVSLCNIIQFKYITHYMQQFFQFIILTFIYNSTCFWRPHAYHQEPNNCLWFYDDTTVKPEAATAVVELLIMGMRTPETC
jgi:hypothetical protein